MMFARRIRPLATALVVLTVVSLSARQAAWVDVMRNLHHPNPSVRLRAVQAVALGNYGAAADAVASLIVDPDRQVRFAAIDAEVTFFLAEPLGAAATSDEAAASSHSRAQAAFEAGPLARAAAVAPSSVVDGLLRALRDDNPRIRFDAIHAIGFIVEPPLTPAVAQEVAAGLDSSDAVFRAATARVLGRLRVQSAAEKLIAALNDRDLVEQRYATEALGLLHEERAVTSLLARVDYFKHGDLAAETLLALARIGHASARDVLRAHVTDDDAAMRRAAIEGLGRIGNHDDQPVVEEHVQKESSPAVRLAAAYGVYRFTVAGLPPIVNAFGQEDTSAQALSYLLEIGHDTVPNLESTLRSTSDTRFRADLIHLLGFVGDHDAVPYIEPFLKDRNDRVARAAIDALARLSR